MNALTETALLEAVALEIEYKTAEGIVRALDDVDLRVAAGEIVGVVGESGSGKTTLGLAAGRLLSGNAHRVGGSLRLAGTPVFECAPEQLRALRQDVLGFVFQNPVASLNPTMRVERQVRLATRDVSRLEIATALEEVGLPDVQRVLRSYPHELSGGMAQRVCIALALLRRPRLLIADEPTAAVDATRRAQVLELLVGRCRAHGCALMLLTHDLHSVARWCSHIAVMYGGRVVEDGPTDVVLSDPMHPYTRALLSALPGDEKPAERLQAIPGVPPVLRERCAGCAFTPRCPVAEPACATARPTVALYRNRLVYCHPVSRQAAQHSRPEDDALPGDNGEASTPSKARALASRGNARLTGFGDDRSSKA